MSPYKLLILNLGTQNDIFELAAGKSTRILSNLQEEEEILTILIILVRRFPKNNHFYTFISLFSTWIMYNTKNKNIYETIGLYSSLNPPPVAIISDWKWIKISLLEETWLGGIELPQYSPIMGDVLEPPS